MVGGRAQLDEQGVPPRLGDDDMQKAHVDWATFSNTRSDILDIIKGRR